MARAAAARPTAGDGAGRGAGRPVTLQDVADRAGVSPKTVSRVANREASVRPATRDRVQQVIDALGFRPDPAARSLRSAQARVIGLVYDNPNAHYVVALQAGVLAACRAADHGLQIYPCAGAAPGLGRELLALVQRGRLAGLVLAPPVSERSALVALLRRHGVRVVAIVSGSAPSRPPRTVRADAPMRVQVDDRRAGEAVTGHLLDLGHRRIGFLAGSAEHRSTAERLAGHVRAHALRGVALPRGCTVHGDYSYDAGYTGAAALLRRSRRPTAIVGCNDEMAAGAIAAVRAAGLRVPDDVSVAGFEDSPFARQSWPPITTARQSVEDIGRRAAELLIGDAAGAGAGVVPIHVVPTLVVRASSGPAPATRPACPIGP